MNHTRLARWHVLVEQQGQDSIIPMDYMVEADTKDQAEAQAAQACVGAVAAHAELIDLCTFQRTGIALSPPTPRAAALARDRFLGARMMEIMADEDIGAVVAYQRAVDELEGRE